MEAALCLFCIVPLIHCVLSFYARLAVAVYTRFQRHYEIVRRMQ